MCEDCFGDGQVELPAETVEYERVVMRWGEKIIEHRHYVLPRRIDACPECARKAEHEYQVWRHG